MAPTTLKSLQTFVIFDLTSTSITICFTGIALIVVSILRGKTYGLTISKNVKFEIFLENYKNLKNLMKELYTPSSLLLSYKRNCMQTIVINKKDYGSSCIYFTKD